MDNLCHTLAGLAMCEAGLRKNTRLAAVTCAIGANLPDVDAFAYQYGRIPALGFRRGWTHGILAMVILPLVLTGLMIAIDRLLRRYRPDDRFPLADGRLLLAAALSVWSHPLLDLCNTYGVRLLMPFSQRWFYGDTLFIIDPWVWLTLLIGIGLSWRARKRELPAPHRPARIALAGATGYIAVMALIGLASRSAARAELAREGFTVSRMMAGPVPLNPLRRFVVAEVGASYTTAEVDWFTAKSPDDTRVWRAGPIVFLGGAEWPKADTLPASRLVARTPEGATFLRWSRFPVFEGDVDGHCAIRTVCIRDLRYYQQGWAEVAIPVRPPLSSPSP
jgi:inner membrane protein